MHITTSDKNIRPNVTQLHGNIMRRNLFTYIFIVVTITFFANCNSYFILFIYLNVHTAFVLFLIVYKHLKLSTEYCNKILLN